MSGNAGTPDDGGAFGACSAADDRLARDRQADVYRKWRLTVSVAGSQAPVLM